MLRLKARHNDEDGHFRLVAETFGTTAGDFVSASLLQLAQITVRNKKPSVEALNASLALIGAVAPENELEAALATQMAATHELSMEMLRRAKVADTTDAMKDYGNLATKLSRTFTAQMKTLSDWRRGGEQVVRHIHVGNGGQAVVAETVNLGGRRNEEISNRGHEPFAALPCADSSRDALPVSGDEGKETLLPARRRPGVRGAKRKQER